MVQPAPATAVTLDPLAALTPEIKEGWVDSLRLLKGAALRLIQTGEHLRAARKLVSDDAEWQTRVERIYPMAPQEAAALVHFAREYGAMKDRLSPAVAMGLEGVLEALGDLYVAVVDPDATGSGDNDVKPGHAETEEMAAN